MDDENKTMIKRTLMCLGYEGTFPIYRCLEDSKIYYEIARDGRIEIREIKATTVREKYEKIWSRHIN